MRNIIIVLAAAGLVTSVSILSCNDTSQNTETVQNNINDSTKIKDSINTEYLKDMETYKKQTADRISANDSSIASFKERIKHEKKEAKVEYDQKIVELEQKNTDMKKKIDDYKAEGKEKWEIFKKEFGHGMDELGKAFKDLTAKI